MTAIILILILYVLPLASMFIFAKMSYGEGGIYEGEDFDMTMFWVMICPLLNILGGFLIWS